MQAPKLTCDRHFHIFGPYDRFPLDADRRYDPPPALVPRYLAIAERLGIQRMVVVQASVSGTYNSVTIDAVRQFGLHRARGVAVIYARFQDASFKTMNDQGIRGVRFNIATGGGTPEAQLTDIARRIAPLGWHIQVYADGDKLAALAPVLSKLPVDVVIDHCGGVMAGLGADHAQFQALLRLLDGGNAWVKTCSYRVSSRGKPWDDTGDIVRALVAATPERCVWGTDWPHPQMDPCPAAGKQLDLFMQWVPDPTTRQRVLVDNPAQLCGF